MKCFRGYSKGMFLSPTPQNTAKSHTYSLVKSSAYHATIWTNRSEGLKGGGSGSGHLWPQTAMLSGIAFYSKVTGHPKDIMLHAGIV
jgi:hypothetical protein